MNPVIPMFIGVFVFLFGAMIVANAAFAERGIFGALIALSGFLIFCGGVVEIAVNLWTTGGVW